ncbi:hypothetical protein OHS59_41680 [Streptomyces sp. NBC_00414]|uniref:hypothetical protein n=1 Tax=Streptomyces sp. NBC_00414 TaxID=2975739 RepID=UPI002E1B2DDD
MGRALDQSVVTEQGPLDFGTHQWPHDDRPATGRLPYRDLGTEPVTLGPSVGAYSVDGKPAAEDMFSVSPERLTVPAGGEVSAAVTADSGAGSADGTSGRGAAAGQRPAKLAFEVSYDEGTTWRSAKAVHGTHLSLTRPAEAGSVSLRATLTDPAGDRLVQTVERACLTTETTEWQPGSTRTRDRPCPGGSDAARARPVTAPVVYGPAMSGPPRPRRGRHR